MANAHDLLIGGGSFQTGPMTTTASCIAWCKGNGHRFAGLQAGNTCYCGNSMDAYGPSGACTAFCSGNPGEICGGTNANSIYMTSYPTNAASAFLGCFVDCPGGTNCQGGASPRDLPNGAAVPNETVEACVAACKGAGYRYAGAQDGSQCFCGNSFGAYGTSGACGYGCAGNSGEICGGIWASDIYITLP
jgi:hypothetical protein